MSNTGEGLKTNISLRPGRKRIIFPGYGLSREARRMALFVLLFLFTAVAGTFVVSNVRSGNAVPRRNYRSDMAAGGRISGQQKDESAARTLALAYYSAKYHDAKISVEIRPAGDHMRAYIRREGVLVEKLSIRDKTVAERPTGLRDLVFDLLTNV